MIRVILLALLTVVVLLLITAGALYAALGQDELKADFAKLQQQYTKPPPPPPEDQIVYYTLPEMRAQINARLVNQELVLFAGELRLHRPNDQVYVQAAMPQIIDAFQCYFRDEQVGNATEAVDVQKLKRVMIERINGFIAPGKIDDILFREMAVQ